MNTLSLHRNALVTADMLARAGACLAQVALVRKHWPNGGRLCVPTLQKAARLGLDIVWLADRFPAPLRDACYKARVPLRDAYYKAHAPLRDAYIKARAPLWGAYIKARAPLRDAYIKARAPLWDAYDKAHAPLWDAYDKAHAPLRDAYDKACAPLRDAYDKAHASALYGVLPPAPEDTD